MATDHASFNSTQKAVGRDDFRLIPNGVHGLEERMYIVWEEMVNSGLCVFAHVCAHVRENGCVG